MRPLLRLRLWRWRLRRGAPGLLILTLIGALFLGSRAYTYGVLRVAFDDTPLPFFWQYLDPILLRDRLWESLMALHTQPPGFNLLLGLLLKLGGSAEGARPLFVAAYLLTGLLLHLGFYRLLVRWRVPRPLALFGTLVLLLSPLTILYEAWLFYTYPVAALLIGLALAAGRAQRRGSGESYLAVALLLAACMLMRSALHLIWAAGLCALLYAASRGRGRASARWLLVALLIGGALYGKNQVRFGFFGASSWLGMSLSKLTTDTAPRPLRQAMVEEGQVSELVLIGPFARLRRYPARLRPEPPDSDPPALREERRSTGHVNYNHRAYLGISRVYMRDSLAMLRAHPEIYRENVERAFRTWAMPPSEYWFLDANRRRIHRLDDLYSALFYGTPQAWSPAVVAYDLKDMEYLKTRESRLFVGALLLALLWALFRGAAALFRARRARWGGRWPERDVDARLPQLLAASTIVFLTVAGNLVEVGENNRFRAMVEPLAFALILAFLVAAFGALRDGIARLLSRPG